MAVNYASRFEGMLAEHYQDGRHKYASYSKISDDPGISYTSLTGFYLLNYTLLFGVIALPILIIMEAF